MNSQNRDWAANTFAQKSRNSGARAELSLASSLLGCFNLARKGTSGRFDSVGRTYDRRDFYLHGAKCFYPAEKQVSYLQPHTECRRFDISSKKGSYGNWIAPNTGQAGRNSHGQLCIGCRGDLVSCEQVLL